MKHIKLFESNENYIPVKPVQDEDGHWYIIPNNEIEEFHEILEKLINTDYNDMDLLDEFDDKFDKYKTGGDLNLKQLYIKL